MYYATKIYLVRITVHNKLYAKHVELVMLYSHVRTVRSFRNGDKSLEEQKDRSRKKSLDNAILKTIVEHDPRVIVRELLKNCLLELEPFLVI